ncbi:MAG: hypothetical protein COV67_05610 [Nitrospinae bacterium CG11_big_fil_rev_8_21_14_0_20_56_8]|nr:MAG: hypothetical protein COV67_05610 [Nitrospinae bacterium CG11_big_fil_rev_8_21_14_0_20_56_8]
MWKPILTLLMVAGFITATLVYGHNDPLGKTIAHQLGGAMQHPHDQQGHAQFDKVTLYELKSEK